MRKPTAEELTQRFLRGGNCAQAVLASAADELDYEPGELDGMGRCFGGGMLRGETCGAVTGALMAIGLLCEDDAEAARLTREVQARFTEKYGSTMCRDLLGYDFADPAQAEQARASGKLLDFCPQVVMDAADLLAEVLDR